MKFIKSLLLYFSISLFFSCQNEQVDVVQGDALQNIITTSPLGNLISRVSQNPTSKDNILDNTSCFSIVLPTTVVVDGKQIVVTSQTDYQIVQTTINAYNNDDDIVTFIYPITIKYKDFKTKEIANSDQFKDVLENCGYDNGGEFDEIECLKINYPITFNVYNTNSQSASNISITSNTELFNLLDNLEKNVVIAINYPISVTNPDGQVVVINNNAALEEDIENAIDDCNTGSNGGGNPLLSTVLTSGTWRVSYSFDHKIEETLLYSEYNFTFKTDETVTVLKNSNVSNGMWSANSDSEKLKLDFETSTLKKLKEDWKVVEYNTTSVRLRHSGDNDDSNYLYLAKN
jgi:hypothetical protein